jgi:hypothetical protein
VEVLLRILGELLEEEGEECIYVLSCSNGVADRATAVGITDVDGLVEEDDRCIGIPRVWVVVKLKVLIDG